MTTSYSGTPEVPRAVQGLLSLHGLHISIGGHEVVSDLELEVRSGQITALVGESGSGKSMTAMATIGLQPTAAEVSGSITLQGDELVGLTAEQMRQVRSRRIGMIFQEPGQSLPPVARIAKVFRHVLEVREHLRSRTDVERRTHELLGAAGLIAPERIAVSYPHELSGGELQRVLIALALAGDPALLIADEPTTALDVTIQRGILDLLSGIASERDVGILLITHDMGVVGEIADDVVVLREGQRVEHGSVTQVLGSPRAPYTQELLTAVPRLSDALEHARTRRRTTPTDDGTDHDGARSGSTADGDRADAPAADAPAVVRIEDLSVDYRRRGTTLHALDKVSVEIARGQVHGLVGESGSGKSTWGKALAGLVPASATELRIDGSDPSTLGRADRRALYRHIGMVFQDPASSLNPRRTVGWSISEPLLLGGRHGGSDARPTRTRRSNAQIDSAVRDALDLVHLPSSMATRLPHELSGGQRQRVSIARALIHRPSLLIADEPTSALDVTTQAHVIEVLQDAVAATQLACIFISHDLSVVGMMADTVTVLRKGHAVEQGRASDVLGSPQHAYTQELLASIPDPARRVTRTAD
jgi:peptide/nickel transport system ATP-binding protein